MSGITWGGGWLHSAAGPPPTRGWLAGPGRQGYKVHQTHAIAAQLQLKEPAPPSSSPQPHPPTCLPACAQVGVIRLSGLAHSDERTAFREIARQLCE